MSIRLIPDGRNFWVELTPPEAEAWRSEAPLTPTEVIEELTRRGCHSTDITDALYAAGPAWAARREAEDGHEDRILMGYAVRAGAIVTGLVASLGVAVSLTWWSHPAFGHRPDGVVVALTFLPGLVAWIAMVLLLATRGRRGLQSVVVDFFATWKNPLFLLLWGWLALVAVVAVVQAKHGARVTGPWGTLPAGTLARCRWALTKDHDTVHRCVSHARWMAVDLNTVRLFIGFATVALVVSCAVFTVLSRQVRRQRLTRAAHANA